VGTCCNHTSPETQCTQSRSTAPREEETFEEGGAAVEEQAAEQAKDQIFPFFHFRLT